MHFMCWLFQESEFGIQSCSLLFALVCRLFQKPESLECCLYISGYQPVNKIYYSSPARRCFAIKNLHEQKLQSPFTHVLMGKGGVFFLWSAVVVNDAAPMCWARVRHSFVHVHVVGILRMNITTMRCGGKLKTTKGREDTK
jgi:hypothetical protein